MFVICALPFTEPENNDMIYELGKVNSMLIRDFVEMQFT